jgi:hypothetical protein
MGKYKNRAHQVAHANGMKAAMEGRDRVSPYGCASNSERYFRRAWLDGYDTGALAACADAMRRSDLDALAPGEAPTTDVEWDNALASATNAIAA